MTDVRASIALRKLQQRQEALGPGIIKKTTDTVVVKKTDLQRIKSLTTTDPRRRAHGATSTSPTGGAGAATTATGGGSRGSRELDPVEERKQRIRQIDQKKQGDTNVLSDIAKENLDRQAALRERARALLDDEEDEVKAMNAMVLYSQCVTIRDAQLAEKKMIAEERKHVEEVIDQQMEMERLKALQMYEVRERKRMEDRKRGAEVIKKQISERERQRMIEAERRDLEQKAMLEHLEQMRAADLREAEERKAAAQRLLEDVEVANAEQIRMKLRERELEQEEDRRIAAYMAEKAAKEKELAEEKLRIAQEKELEIARLRALQEKALDKQAELDALRAKRSQEQAEREYRLRERAEMEKRKAQLEQLASAREEQRLERERRLASLAKQERDEFERIILLQQEADHQQKEAEDINQRRRLEFADSLRQQIDEVEETKRRERMAFVEEGTQLAKERAMRDARIESIRQKKVQDMRGAGVPAKYTVELQTKRLGAKY